MKRKLLKSLIAALSVMLSALPLKAQSETLLGTVKDANGVPIIGAYVIDSANSTNGAITNLDGEFSLKINLNGTITVSCLGYMDAKYDLSGRSSIDIVLLEDTTMLEETVVIGYGSVKKSDLTGAVASVNSKVLSDKATSNVGQILQGRMSGVYIVDSGNPQSDVSIKIRGLGTVNNSNPLIVIDGVPMVNMSLNNLNSNDIESVDILKDASATAIYGARGANGVVIVTTKRGTNADGTLNFATNLGVDTATSMPELLNASEYASLNNDMMLNSSNAPNPDWTNPASLGEGTNWLKAMIHPAFFQNYNLSYYGGNDKNQYYVSGSYTDHDGIVNSVAYKKLTFQINLDNQVKEWIKFSTNLTCSYDNKTNGDYSMSAVLKSVPALSIYREDGTYNGPTANSLWFGDQQNQVGKSTVNKNQVQGYNLLLSEGIELFLCKGLKFKSVESVGATLVESESFRPAYNWTPDPLLESERWAQYSRNMSFLADNYFTYDGTFGSHSITAMAGSSLQWGNNFYFNGQKKGFLSDTASQFNNGINIESLNGTRSDWAIASFMARVNYTYLDRYMFTATFRADGSSKFGPNSRWGYFPSFAGAWRLSEEPWFPKNKTITYLKIRVGYGVTGNQEIGDYTFASVYNTGQYSFNGNVVQSLVANKLSNPNIRWEEVEQYNVGFDLSLFNSRLRVSLDGYIKNTNGMLVKMVVPISTGYSDIDVPYINEGKIKNTGLELSLGSDNIISKEFYWGSSFVISFNKNEIK